MLYIKKVKIFIVTIVFAILFCSVDSCDNTTSDTIQHDQNQTILQQAAKSIGMPNIKNFREARLVKYLLEQRDSNISTYTYVFSPMIGKFIFIGNSIGYGIPYATEFTNPQQALYPDHLESPVIAQADPNALFPPTSAEGTWIFIKDPQSDEVKACYFEERLEVVPFPLPKRIVLQ